MHNIEYHFNKDSINVTEHINPVCNYSVRGKDKLLITIGDSWTWGDNLLNNGYKRIPNLWGNHLSKFLDTDWLNIARRGASNLWIFYQIEELVRYKNNYKDLNYKHIQIIVCCTEWGREYSEDWKWHPMDPGQDPKPPVMQNFDILNYCRPYLDELDADILITHNFCDSSFWIHSMPQLEKNWVEITCENLKCEYDYVIPTIIHYENLKKTGVDLQFITDMTEKSIKLLDVLRSCKYNFNTDSPHPKPASHKLWAQYIFNNIKDSI